MNIEQQLKSTFSNQPQPEGLSDHFQDQVMAKIEANATKEQSQAGPLLKVYWLIAAVLLVAIASQVSWATTTSPAIMWVVGGALVMTVVPLLLLTRLAGFSLSDLVWRTIDR